jgi:hypothetical protein
MMICLKARSSENGVSSKGDNNQAVVGDDETGVGVNGQQVEYIDLESYEPSGQSLLRKKTQADKFETRLEATRNDVTRTNTAQATFAPVLLEMADSFTAAVIKKTKSTLTPSTLHCSPNIILQDRTFSRI